MTGLKLQIPIYLLCILGVKDTASGLSMTNLAYHSLRYKLEKNIAIDDSLLSKIKILKDATEFNGQIFFPDSIEAVSDDFAESLQRSNAVFIRSIDMKGKTRKLILPDQVRNQPLRIGNSFEEIVFDEVCKPKESGLLFSLSQDSFNSKISLQVKNADCSQIDRLELKQKPSLVTVTRLSGGFFGVLVSYAKRSQFRRRNIASDEVYVLNRNGSLDFAFSIENTFYSPRYNVSSSPTNQNLNNSFHASDDVFSTFKKILFGSKNDVLREGDEN